MRAWDGDTVRNVVVILHWKEVLEYILDICKSKYMQQADRHHRVCIFLILDAPSYTPRSIAAATVNVPPITAQTPVKKPANDFVLSSRLMTFIGEISYTDNLTSVPSFYESDLTDFFLQD
jgi:hypothetical protein